MPGVFIDSDTPAELRLTIIRNIIDNMANECGVRIDFIRATWMDASSVTEQRQFSADMQIECTHIRKTRRP